MQNIHLMQSHLLPAAPTNEARLPDTCRSSACHPTAGHAVSTAAIHLELSTSRGIEYFIAALFVLLILFTFGPSVMLLSLELLQLVLDRNDPEHHHRLKLAETLQADPRGRRALCRFTLHQRVQHWMLALTFTTLVLTGFPLKFADRRWARWIVDLFGGVPVTRVVHRWAGVLLIAGFAYHFGYVAFYAWRDHRRTGRGWLKTLLSLPMVTNRQDLKQLGQLLAYLLFLRRTRPALGRFSLEEKFEYFGVFWGSALLGVTGLLMWGNAWTSLHLTGRVLTVAALIHTFEAFLALLHVGIMHMVGVIFSPTVFPLSRAMFTGQTPAEELAEAHGEMLAEVAQKLGIQSKEASDV
jgi:cytochrome b subunit of formate dehydrogenase